MTGPSRVFWDIVERLGTGLHERTFIGQYAWQFADYCAGKLALMSIYVDFPLAVCIWHMAMDCYEAELLCYRLQKSTLNNLEWMGV